ncbi:MAG: DUF1080 domain-containing protein [Bacteroidetes bacterium]|nr:MAG: DUF1080 domain-containing protein [Bacteroidota bacterium]
MCKKIAFILLSSLLAINLAVASPPGGDDGWIELFNGQNLDGWVQRNGQAKYRVENGEIVGTTVLNSPNSFLCTEKNYGDFILELEFKVDDFNCGIQIRSESKPEYRNGRVHGYQVEIDPSDRAWSGGIYDEARRGWLYPLELNPPARKAFHKTGWNHYRIEAIGPSIRTWVNGVPAADLIDDMTLEGFIGLQVHGIGNNEKLLGKEIRWKNIRIKTDNLLQSPWTNIPVVNNIPNYLSPQERAQGWQLLFDGKSTKGWRRAGKETFPEKGWKVENGELIVESSDGAESANGGDIVTEDEYTTFELQLEFMITPGANSGIKYFITESYGAAGSAIGLEYQILDDEKHPDATKGAAGNRTVASLYDLIPADASKQVNKPGEWNKARLVVKGTRQPQVGPVRNMPPPFKGAYVEHWLNNHKVLEYVRGDQMFDALVARSKYAKWEGFGHWQSGHILLQDHGDEVHFRSIKIRRLD